MRGLGTVVLEPGGQEVGAAVSCPGCGGVMRQRAFGRSIGTESRAILECTSCEKGQYVVAMLMIRCGDDGRAEYNRVRRPRGRAGVRSQ